MTMWLPKLESRRGPVYRAIADALDEDVQNGRLRAGMRLPPHRDLADHLGVTVTTITRAYAEAARRGLTSGYVGRGTYIRGNEAEERGTETTPFDLSINILMPDTEVANLQPRMFQRRVLPWTQILGYVGGKDTCGTARPWRRGWLAAVSRPIPTISCSRPAPSTRCRRRCRRCSSPATRC
jgi:DNA-binding transcriptional regulator YhcF (GntR family)